jgi:F420-0:gamma-glutamyl ligase
MYLPGKELGVVAYGVKTGIITSDDNIIEVIKNTIEKNPDLISDRDIMCVTESVVAISQNNVVKLSDVSREIKSRLNLEKDSTVGVVHPILSRNRFSMLLKAIAKSVPAGKVVIQLKFPADEQGNPVISKKTLKRINKKYDDIITVDDIGSDRLLHPETGMDYIQYYETIVNEAGCDVEIFLANSFEHIINRNPDAIIVSNVHKRKEVYEIIRETGFRNVISLQDIYSDPLNGKYSEFGLLGSNLLDPVNEELKLMPKYSDKVCEEIRKMVSVEFGKNIEVIIYGDGAYKDPESGIFELADPVSCFGCTQGIKNRNRIGVKTKYLMQKLHNEGRSREEIERTIQDEGVKLAEKHDKLSFSAQGTTPRKIENLVSSLADLVSGSGDENTPVVIVRGFI